jgi:hypothetical protein
VWIYRPPRGLKDINEVATKFGKRLLAAPLARAVEIGELNILDRRVLVRLAGQLGCTPWEAAQWWLDLVKLALPYVVGKVSGCAEEAKATTSER